MRAPLRRMKVKGGLVVVVDLVVLDLVVLGEVRVGAKAARKARGYWVWIEGLLVGAPRALFDGGGRLC